MHAFTNPVLAKQANQDDNTAGGIE